MPGQPAEQGIRTNIAGIVEAVNAMDLEKYGRLVTDDFLNMNKDLEGEVTSTVGRQARLDVLRFFFDKSPFVTKITMEPVEVHVDGDRGFARIDGTVQLTPKPASGLSGYGLKLDLYLFYRKDGDRGWLSERSMGVEKARI